MTEARLADGRILRFPDGTDPAIIQNTVKRVLANEMRAPIGTGRPKQTLSPEGGRKGSFLPLSTDPEGNLQFDLSAGITGAIGDALALPGDVATGKTNAFVVDPASGAAVANPEMVRRATGLAMVANPIGAATRAGERAIPGVSKNLRPVPPKAPTAQALKEAGSAGFESARAMGVDYSSAAIKTWADDLQQSLEAEGFRSVVTPKTFGVIRELQSPPDGSVAAISDIIALRKTLQKIAGNIADREESKAATKAIKALDSFLAEPPPASVVAGPAAAAAQTIERARGNTAAAFRSDRVTGAQERAELNAAVANSGLNAGNQIRQRLRDILVRPKDARGYSQEELAFIQQVVDGKFGSELARYAGNLLGGGGGLGQALTTAGGAALGSMAGGAPGAGVGAMMLPAIGAASRHLYNRMVRGQVAKLDEAIRKRSPLYQKMLQTAPLAAHNPKARDAFLRSLLLLLEAPDEAGGAPISGVPANAHSPGLLGNRPQQR